MREPRENLKELGDLPAITNPARRKQAEQSLLFFLQDYFPSSTGLSPFSEDHVRVIGRIQRCLTRGGKFLNVVFRGFGKTTVSQNSGIWGVATGKRRYIAIFAAEKSAADENLHAIKSELETNDDLFDDFPEICYPVRALDGKPQRCAGQAYVGERTMIGWKGDRILLPTIPGSNASGAIIACRGITGSGARGLNHRTPEGTAQRPDMVIIDDIQTDKSAASAHQVNALIGTITKAIGNLGGHNKSISCVMNATALAPNDVVEQLLDPKLHKAWSGERIKMVRKWSDANDTLWFGTASGYEGECYERIRCTFDREDEDDQQRAAEEATAFYLAHRNEMDAGCDVAWAGCFDPECEVSAIQHSYNMLIDLGPATFATECQCQPLRAVETETARVPASVIVHRLNGFDRYKFPRECQHLTAYIDLQGALLYYVVCAWSIDFTGYVVDYSAFPDQERRYFTLNDAQRTLEKRYQQSTQEGQWAQGLADVLTLLTTRQWSRADGAVLPLSRVLIDANYGASTGTVKRFCQVSPHRGILLPSHGRGVTADQSPMSDWEKKPGELRGLNWLVRPDGEGNGLRHILIDTNWWKTFVHTRLRGLPAERSSLSLWGLEPQAHEMIADQIAAEAPTRTRGRNRNVDVWKLPPNKPDNHLFDCVVGCAVAASMQGCALPEYAAAVVRKRKSLKVKW